jgi:hypothetical protein
LLAVRFRSVQTVHMGNVVNVSDEAVDVVVNGDKWEKLHDELERIQKDAGKVNSFMVKHVNTTWEV